MTVYEYKLGKRLPVGKCAVAIGFFDGVHLAHRELILAASEEAKRLGVAAGVVTFASESSIKAGIPRLYDTCDKLSLIESLGVDFTVICDFSDVAGLSGEEFVRDTLSGDIGAVSVAAGFNFKFGKGASSDAESLKTYMQSLGGNAIIKKPYLYGDAPLSSSMIRSLLAEGRATEASRALGTPYFVTGEVSRGMGVGRGLGFPTVNLDSVAERVKLKHGVYRCAVLIENRLYHAVTNVGICPTFDKRDEHIEAHLIDFSGDLYGKSVRVYFLGYLREERRFDSQKELITQINIDKNRTLEENGENLWQEIGLS